MTLELNKIKQNQKWLLVFLSLVVANFILKILFVSSSEIGLDEPFSIFYAQKSIYSILRQLSQENNPPLYLILLHFWIKIFGIDPFSVRLPSVICSSITGGVIYLIGRRFFSFRIGLFAALIFTASNLHIYFAHDTRAYALFVLLCSLNLYYFLDILSQNTERAIFRNRIVFTIVNILLCYTHFFGFVVLGTELFTLLLFKKYRYAIIRCGTSFLFALLTYLWYVPILINRFKISVSGTWIEKPALTDLYTMIWRFSNKPVLAVVFILIVFAGIGISIRRQKSGYFNIFLSLFLISFFGLFLVSYSIPVFVSKYLLFASLYFYFLIAASIDTFLDTKILRLVFPLGIILLSFSTTNLKTGKDSNFRAASSFVQSLLDKNYNVCIMPAWYDHNFIYYFNRSWFKCTGSFYDSLAAGNIYPMDDYREMVSLPVKNRLILLRADLKNDSLNTLLKEKYTLRKQKEYGPGLVVQDFQLK